MSHRRVMNISNEKVDDSIETNNVISSYHFRGLVNSHEIDWRLFCWIIFGCLLTLNCTFRYIAQIAKTISRSIWNLCENSASESSSVRWVATTSHRRGRLIHILFETLAKIFNLCGCSSRHNRRNWFSLAFEDSIIIQIELNLQLKSDRVSRWTREPSICLRRKENFSHSRLDGLKRNLIIIKEFHRMRSLALCKEGNSNYEREISLPRRSWWRLAKRNSDWKWILISHTLNPTRDVTFPSARPKKIKACNIFNESFSLDVLQRRVKQHTFATSTSSFSINYFPLLFP